MNCNQATFLAAALVLLIAATNSVTAQATAGPSICPFGYVNITASASSHSSSSSSVVVSGGSAVIVTSSNATSSSSVTVTIGSVPSACQPAVPCDCPIDQECVAYEPKYCFTTPCPQWSCRNTSCTGGQTFNRTTLSCECPPGYDFNTTSNQCFLPNSTICLPDTCTGTDICYEIVQECDTCPQFRCCPAFSHWNQTRKECVADDACAASPCPENAACSNCFNCTEGFKCTCLPGYRSNGTACLPKNPCEPNPCPDHAYCHAVNQTIAQCRCDTAYQPSTNGTQCVLRNPCEPNPCPSNSFCAMLTPFRARCICDCGYTLSANKTQCLFNPCFPNRCKCGKQCVANGTDYTCVNPVCPLGTQYSETACGCANFTCPLGWHFETALKICVPNDFPCAGTPCPAGQVCQYRPQNCPCSPPTCTLITGSAKATSSCTASATVVVPWGSVSSNSSATAEASSTYTAYQCSTPSCKCPQYQCVPAGAPSCPAGQSFDSFTGACVSNQPISVNVTQGCVFCAAVVPRCSPACAADEDCQITNQDCNNCATARCIKRVVQSVGCVSCPAQQPVCPFCPFGKTCQVTQQSCNQCATATCV